MSERVAPPVLVIILDGLGDRPWPQTGGMTPLAAAPTPNLDALAAVGATGILHPLGPGRAPGTDLAHFVLLGYDSTTFPGRAVFEAASAGIALELGRVALHAILATVKRRSDGSLTILERYPADDIAPAGDLFAAISSFRHGDIAIELQHIRDKQALLLISGPASEEITDTDPHNNGWLVGSVQALSGARDRSAATQTAAALTAYLKHSYAALRSAASIAADDDTSPFLLLKWVGRRRELPPFAERTGMSGAVVSSAGVLQGLASELGLSHRRIQQLPDVAQDMRERLAIARTLLAEGTDFVLVHNKAPDEAGHLKDPLLKRDVIRAIDQGLEGLATRTGLPSNTVVLVTADHGTPSGTSLIHSGDPVPLAVLSNAARPDEVTRFDELACARGSLGHVRGEDFMHMIQNWRGTVRYTGGRLTPHTGLHWPNEYEPFVIGGAE